MGATDTESAVKPVAEWLNETFNRVEAAAEAVVEITGLPTGFDGIDRATGGLEPGQLVVVAGGPSSGKSALVRTIAQFVAVQLDQPVLYADAYNPGERVARSMAAGSARIDQSRFKAARLEELDWRKLGDALGELAGSPMQVLAGEEVNLEQLEQDVSSSGDFALVVIDGLSLLIDRAHTGDDGRWDTAARVVHGLKRLALDAQVTIVVTTAIGRGPQARTDKRPWLEDLTETAALAYDADLVLMVYRDELHDPDSPDLGVLEVTAVKHRDGPTWRVKLALLDHLQRVANLAVPLSLADLPSEQVPTAEPE
jgi:replicative DNA helicase